jgi:alpha-N-acetylglucosaminidase
MTFAFPPQASAPKSPTLAASRVMARTIGKVAARFRFRLCPSMDGTDCFTFQAQDGRVDVSGSSAVAICRAAYEYLKDYCHCQVSWSGDNLALPKTLPSAPLVSVHTPCLYRHYFNVCTFGYTTAWWDWKRWQREIDWMALHGINMPLAMTGQEKVWRQTFLGLGIPRSSIDHFFTGPAFLPWHRMGNLDTHMGPLSQDWIDGQADLQKQILSRERELGMTPIVPGFSGFVPADFKRWFPSAKLDSPSAWAGFSPTTFISPLDPLFVTVGTAFLKNYVSEFGSDHFYLCDTFNEMIPRFPAKEELRDLSATGGAVYRAIKNVDPDGTWVTQGWLFYNAQAYWTQERTAALLSKAPPGKMVVLDLATTEHEVWRDQPAVRNGGWIFNTLHNYGQTTNLYGDLQHYIDVERRAVNDPQHGRMLGEGLTPEGIDQNPVVYELMTDAMWHPEIASVDQWLTGYVASRYGLADSHGLAAWKLLMETVYGSSGGFRDPWRYRPSLGISTPNYDLGKMKAAVRELLASAVPRTNNLYRRDLVDVTKTWIGGQADIYLAAALASFDDDRPTYQTFKEKYLTCLDDLDLLMATRPEHRLSTWLNDAKGWGKTPEEKALLEQNARMQITVWGGPELYDYANKEWAGLNRDFIKRRWELLFDALEKGGASAKLQTPDFLKWETTWALSTRPIQESRPKDSYLVSQSLFSKYENEPSSLEALLKMDDTPGIAVGKPVSDSGGFEGDHRPELAVDGKITGNYWAASPSPQWLQIDLTAPRNVDEVRLYPYFGDGRYYQYKIEVSLDGSAWSLVADGSKNTEISTFKGYDRKFTPTPARYVRVTMLNNSANSGVHLYEVRVFESR